MLLATVPLAAAPKVVFAEEPKGDEKHFVEIQELLPYRDGVLGLERGLHFMKYDSKVAEKFPVGGIGLVTSIGKLGDAVLFLGIKESGEWVLAEEKPGQEVRVIPLPRELREPLPPPSPGKGVRPPALLDSSRWLALTGPTLMFGERTVWWLEGEEWKNRKLPEVPKFYPEFEPDELGGQRYLLGETLFVGWDHGEWGGMLASIDLKDEKAQWVHLSGKKQGDTTGIPENQPVRKILSTDGKTLWVATGLAHLGGTWSGLSRRDGDGRWSTLISTVIDDVSGPLSLPKDVSLSTMAADAKGDVYLLGQGAGAGVFRLEEKAISQVMDHPFMHVYDAGPYLVGCYPGAMAIGKQGDIFVATNAFGTLAFHKNGEAWKGRQILVKQDE